MSVHQFNEEPLEDRKDLAPWPIENGRPREGWHRQYVR